jgi:hypothetical protein
MDAKTAVIREAILALHENWISYYGPNGEDVEVEPDRVEQFQALMHLAEQVCGATVVDLVVKDGAE